MIYNKNLIFGKKLKEFREKIKPKMTQEKLWKLTGLRASHISSIECGHRKDINISTALNICNALNVTFDELVLGVK